ncbi:DUF4468 domain-containing protein [Pontibacter sp. H249]|uniref:DUF4468 domain-containing protein n=1 Tax=Pontibacter sp. H249 TaxID=3133420 RepID=UPI0030BF9633
MKKLILSLLFILPLAVMGHNLPVANGKITYSEVVSAEGLTQEQLYQRLREFFTVQFKSADDVIQMDTKDKVIGKAWQDIIVDDGKVQEKRKLWYTVKLEMKEGRYRIELSDFHMQRYCLPAYGPCEPQTRLFPAEQILSPQNQVNKKGKPSVGYASFEREIEKAATALMANIKEAAAQSSDW